MMAYVIALAWLPLLIDLRVDFPFEPVKLWWWTWLTLASVISVAITRGAEIRKQFRWTRMDTAVSGVLLALVVSTIFSVDPINSLFGMEERRMGLFAYLIGGMTYALMRTMTTWKEQKWFFRASIVSVILTSAYGIWQWTGHDFTWWLRDVFPLYGVTGPHRAYGTLGHPIFLGCYLAMLMPFLFWMMRYETFRVIRIGSAIATALGLVVLFMTYARGSWLALLAGVAMMIVVQLPWARVSRKTIAVSVVSVGIVVAMFVGVLAPRMQSSSNSVIRRIGSITDLRSGSGISRVIEWQYALPEILRHPIVGHGLETYFSYALERPRDPREHNDDFAQTDPSYADRLHNLVMDVAWTSGILGLIAYGYFIFAIASRCHALLRTSSRTLAISFIGAFTAYLVQLMTVFDFSISMLFLFAFAGMVQNLDNRENV